MPSDTEQDVAFRSDLEEKAVVCGNASLEDVFVLPHSLDPQRRVPDISDQVPKLVICLLLDPGRQLPVISREMIRSD